VGLRSFALAAEDAGGLLEETLPSVLEGKK
jgi:hypothetical protein